MLADLNSTRRILILGGTSEASQLAATLAARPELTVITSLAGRISNPDLPGGEVRVGGFGGADGLGSYLREENISVVVDVTHPFAARISSNVEQACKYSRIPLLAFDRPSWKPVEHDQWTHVADVHAAAALVCKRNSRIFLSIGRQEVGAFSHCKDPWFLIRAIDYPTEPLPPKSRVILDRGPFDLSSELRILREESIDLLISKNSGGPATYPKIEAAREANIQVIIIDRPAKHSIPTISTLGELMDKLCQILESNRPFGASEAI